MPAGTNRRSRGGPGRARSALTRPPPCANPGTRAESAAYEEASAGRDLFGHTAGDASAGPNPGGGFYGVPNIDIGRINP